MIESEQKDDETFLTRRLELSEFPLFPRVENNPLALHILSFLSAEVLCRLSMTSKSFHRITLSPILWKSLLVLDFEFEAIDKASILSTPNILLPRERFDLNDTQCRASKSYYIKQLKEVRQKVELAKDAKSRLATEANLDRRVRALECCLDTSLVRFIAPLPAGTLFATLLMIGLRVDGANLSIWVCLSPFSFLLIYTLLSGLLTRAIYSWRDDSRPPIRELWTNLRGPIPYFYSQVVDYSHRTIYLALSIIMLILLQAILLCVKVSTGITPLVHENMTWGIALLPLWCLFTIYLFLPFFGVFQGSVGPFFASVLLLWMPLFIFFVCVAVKLDSIEDNSKEQNMRIALILIPFWMLEGIIMIATLLGLIVGILRSTLLSPSFSMFYIIYALQISEWLSRER